MPVFTLHCPACSGDFVESRLDVKEGDEAICPKCGARLELTAEFVRAENRAASERDVANTPIHVEPIRGESRSH